MDLKKFEAITQGFKNFVFPNEYMEKLATERAKICSTCEHADPNHKFKKWVPADNRTKEIKGMGCSLCGCLLSAKVRQVLESCPDKPKRWE